MKANPRTVAGVVTLLLAIGPVAICLLFGQPKVSNQHVASASSAPALAPRGSVWVNTSGVYHYPGSRWYGATTRGKYMSEADALKSGYRPAQNGQ